MAHSRLVYFLRPIIFIWFGFELPLLNAMGACGGGRGAGFSGMDQACHPRKALEKEDAEEKLSTGARTVKTASEMKADDAKCVGTFDDFCTFVDPLPIPDVIDGATGEVITLGFYTIKHKFHRDLPESTVYGIGETIDQATTPGPTIMAARNVTTNIQWKNYITENLYYRGVFSTISADPLNGGTPIVMHLHGGETEPESDGHPEAWFTHTGEHGRTFKKSLYTYTNAQYEATLWYHDHTIGVMEQSKIFGLAGVYILQERGMTDFRQNLPEGDYDIPLLFSDRYVLPNGTVLVVGEQASAPDPSFDIRCINNKAWPYLDVKKTKYRFRLVQAMRAYSLQLALVYVDSTTLVLSNGTTAQLPRSRRMDFQIIATDGGYVETPVTVNNLLFAMGERYEIIVDFDVNDTSGDAEAYFIDLENTQLDEDGLPKDRMTNALMKFYVTDLFEPSFDLPEVMVPFEVPNTSDAGVTRYISWLSTMVAPDYYQRKIGGRGWVEAATEITTQGTTEIWYILNEDVTLNALHTIHLHAVRFRLISRQTFNVAAYSNGSCSLTGEPNKASCYVGAARLPEVWEMGWKDTLYAMAGEVTGLMFTSSSQDGSPFPFDPSNEPHYVWHCHINAHSDYEMMRPFLIVPAIETAHAGVESEGQRTMMR
eukprot:TRINITY_DN4235_c0_g1_i1.p1 TRINITY_DN4235_c0_g1~~TRINITY_DN4235_c0_g1_i1.p1  ORF type:complete len:653 (+),score=54.77 TRINITY_DN4235_c0_g1_i1:338-2296(+)